MYIFIILHNIHVAGNGGLNSVLGPPLKLGPGSLLQNDIEAISFTHRIFLYNSYLFFALYQLCIFLAVDYLRERFPGFWAFLKGDIIYKRIRIPVVRIK